MKHKHYDIIVAWAAGETIQARENSGQEWKDLSSNGVLGWYDSMQYRVKPKEIKLIPHWPAIINSVPTARITQNVYSSIEEAKQTLPPVLAQRVLRLATEYPPIILPEKEPILKRR